MVLLSSAPKSNPSASVELERLTTTCAILRKTKNQQTAGEADIKDEDRTNTGTYLYVQRLLICRQVLRLLGWRRGNCSRWFATRPGIAPDGCGKRRAIKLKE